MTQRPFISVRLAVRAVLSFDCCLRSHVLYHLSLKAFYFLPVPVSWLLVTVECALT